MSLLKRLTVLQDAAANVPVPGRKFFHIGKVETVDDVGECIPMMAWASDNLSRYVIADAPSNAWGIRPNLFKPLPNLSVNKGEGIFLVACSGEHRSEPHPGGTGKMHFVYLGLKTSLSSSTKLYVYRLEGVQVATL